MTNDEPNYITVKEMQSVILILEGLNAVSVAEIYLDEVTVFDTNGDTLGKIAYREPGYVFFPGNPNLTES